MIVFDALPLHNAHRVRGIGSYVRGVLQSLGTAGAQSAFDIRLLMRGDAEETPSFAKPIYTWRPQVPRVRLNWLFSTLLLPYDFRGDARRAVLFHATDPNALCRPHRVPMLATAYDLIPLHFPELYLHRVPRDVRAGYQVMLRRYRRAEHLIAISQATKNDFIARLGIAADRISVIHPCITAIARNTVTTPLSKCLPTAPSRFFLYVGAVDPRKNLGLALEAFAAAGTGVTEDFVLAGQLSDGERNQLLDTARRLGIADRLYLLGRVTNAQLTALYRDATALVFPSRWEGFGLPVLEAMQHDCPVICSTAGALQEVVGDAALTFELEEPSQLTQAMLELSQNPAQRASLIAKGADRLRFFDPLETGRKFMQLYDHLAS